MAPSVVAVDWEGLTPLFWTLAGALVVSYFSFSVLFLSIGVFYATSWYHRYKKNDREQQHRQHLQPQRRRTGEKTQDEEGNEGGDDGDDYQQEDLEVCKVSMNKAVLNWWSRRGG